MSSDTNTLIDIRDVELTTGCDAELCNELGCAAEFYFGKIGIQAPTWMEIEPVFAPRKMTGDYLITWSLDWNAPFRVCSILYLTSPNRRYILVYREGTDDDFASVLLHKLRENRHLNVQKAGTDELAGIEYFYLPITLFDPVTDSYGFGVAAIGVYH